MQLRKATRQKAKIRLGLSASSGGGKTYSAILVAKGLCGDLSKVAVIDTENNSADLYAHLGDYNVLPLTSPYTPERYVEAIIACEKAGMEVIIIDSISHEWDGKGGCLDIVASLGGKYQDWGKVTPRHQKFLEAILGSPAHIITTVRRKQDYEMTKEQGGKVSVQKVGLKEVTRDGFEYELTTNLEIDTRHYATASKDRTNLFAGKPEFVPGVETGELIRQWCESGAELLPQTDQRPELTMDHPSWPAALENYASGKVTLEAIDKKYLVRNGAREALLKAKEQGVKPVTVTAPEPPKTVIPAETTDDTIDSEYL